VNKKKTRKSRAAKSVRDLPEKTPNVKTAKAVKGGEGPTESISFSYGRVERKY
jgi:hypothetical protein